MGVKGEVHFVKVAGGGGMRNQTCGGHRKRQFKILMSRFGSGCAIPDEDGTEPEGSVLTPMGADLPLLPYRAGDVEVAITTGFAGTNAFPLEGPLPLHSFEPSRSTGNFDCTFKCGSFPSVYRCIRADGFGCIVDPSRNVYT